MSVSKEEIIRGIPCETCSEERVFGKPPDDRPENKYVYIDLSGTTRCFCKKHMSYFTNSGAIKSFDEKWDGVGYGAVLVSELLKET